MTEDEINNLKNQIANLTLKLEKRDSEIETLIKNVQDLEDELLEFHQIIAEGVSLQSIEQVIESKYKFELKSKDREIRELKNKLGFLRKDYLKLERDLDAIKQKSINSSVLRVEDIRYEHNLEIKDKRILELDQTIKEKDRKIKILNELVSKKEPEQLSQLDFQLDKSSELSNKNSKDDYKKKIKKYKNKIEQLKRKLSESGQDDKAKIKIEIELLDLKNMNSQLLKKLDHKEKRIRELESLIGIPKK